MLMTARATARVGQGGIGERCMGRKREQSGKQARCAVKTFTSGTHHAVLQHLFRKL
jgi:hypothetical protein